MGSQSEPYATWKEGSLKSLRRNLRKELNNWLMCSDPYSDAQKASVERQLQRVVDELNRRKLRFPK